MLRHLFTLFFEVIISKQTIPNLQITPGASPIFVEFELRTFAKRIFPALCFAAVQSTASSGPKVMPRFLPDVL